MNANKGEPRPGEGKDQGYLEYAPRALLVPLSPWDSAGVWQTLHDSPVFVVRGDTGVMQG